MQYNAVAFRAGVWAVGSLLAGALACIPAVLCAQTDIATLERGANETRRATTRIEVSLDDRMLWVLSGNDTLRAAPIAVAKDSVLQFGNRRWTFHTPRGQHTILRKRADPVWRPPDWHYAEAALENGWRMQALPARGVTLRDGRRVLMRNSQAGLLLPDGGKFLPLPVDEHIVFDSTLYVPPIGSRNREVAGELGRYALDIGDGYLLHGTPDQSSVGNAVTHGCLRLLNSDIAWLYENVPVGTVVVIR